ncbi:MAG: hypothetical protein KAX37_11865 [Opitutaceae bacterium]|nr:hypothetical protein [Opitutaceae bacterium]
MEKALPEWDTLTRMKVAGKLRQSVLGPVRDAEAPCKHPECAADSGSKA